MGKVSRDENRRPIILWVEDDPSVSLLRFIPEEIAEKEAALKAATGVRQLASILNEIDENGDLGRIKGIILDIMIPGTPDLAVFKRPDVKLGRRGEETGMKLLEYVFRNKDENNAFRALNNVPNLVLTIKPTTYQSDFDEDKYDGKIRLVRKFDRFSKWESEVKRWIADRTG